MDQHIIDAACVRAMMKDMTWGTDDCSLWVCDIILEETAADLAKPLRGKYRTRAGAMRVMKRFCGGGLVETALTLAGAHELKRVEFPWAGTLVGIVAGEQGPTLALFFENKWLGRTETGYRVLPASFGVMAWELPTCRR